MKQLLNTVNSIGRPMFRILGVPLNCHANAIVEFHLLFPPETLQCIGHHRITAIVEVTVFDMNNRIIQFGVRFHQFQQDRGDFHHPDLVFRANVVNHLCFPLANNQIHGAYSIGDVNEVSHLFAVAMNSHLLTVQDRCDETWNDLLGKLIRTVDIVTTGDHVRQFETLSVGFHQKFCCRFGCCVRVGWIEHCCFMTTS